MLESSIDDDGEKWAQEAPRADGHRGAEVRKRIRVAGAGLWGAALPEWRSAKRIRALDGIAARRSAQSLPAVAGGETFQRGRAPAAPVERGHVLLFGTVFVRGNGTRAGKTLGRIFDNRNDGVFDASGDLRNLRACDVADSCCVGGEYCGGCVFDFGAATDKDAGALSEIIDSSERTTGSELSGMNPRGPARTAPALLG